MTNNDAQEVKNLISGSQRILITTRDHPGYDEMSCALAWFLFLQAGGTKVQLAANPQNVHRYRFLPGIESVQADVRTVDHFVIKLNVDKAKVQELSYDLQDDVLEIKILPKDGNFTPNDVSFGDSKFAFDAIIVIGAADQASIGQVFSQHKELFFKVPIINIDRQSRNLRYGQINVIDLKSTSLAEVSYEFMNERMTKDIATCLLTGLIAATNSFQTPQVTPATLKLASDLIIAGAPRADIVSNLYRTKDMDRLKVWGRILTRLKQVETRLVYSYITQDDLADKAIDLPSLVDDLVLASPEADMVLFFTEMSDHRTQVYMYSRENYDLHFLLQSFAPEGSRHQVSFVIEKPRPEVEDEVVRYVRDRLKLVSR